MTDTAHTRAARNAETADSHAARAEAAGKPRKAQMARRSARYWRQEAAAALAAARHERAERLWTAQGRATLAADRCHRLAVKAFRRGDLPRSGVLYKAHVGWAIEATRLICAYQRTV